MKYADRLSDADELLFEEIVKATYNTSTHREKKGSQRNGKNIIDRSVTIKPSIHPHDSPEGRSLKSFIESFRNNGLYKIDLDSLIQPSGYYLPPEPDTVFDKKKTGTSSAILAYSTTKYIWSHYISGTDVQDHKESLIFFQEQLVNAEKLLKADYSSKIGQFWFDLFWVFCKKTLKLCSKQTDIEGIVRLHNKFWTNRIKPRVNYSEQNWHVFLGLTELPTDFINDEIDAIISGIFPNSKSVYGTHPLLYKCIIDALNFAKDNESCLILGETGTGKESIAKLIHAASYRRENNFVPLNCSGFTDSLFNSEVFGILKGAATNAETNVGAILEAAGGKKTGDKITYPDDPYFSAGTLFLDEINSLSLDHQAKFLRVIQEKEVKVVGGSLLVTVDFKVVCAGNEDLQKKCREGTFRKDLYHRISTGIITVPTLWEMRDIILDIAIGKLEEQKAKTKTGEEIYFSENALLKLKEYTWPGNIRELENTIYKLFWQMMIEDRTKIEPDDIEFPNKFTEGEETRLFEELAHQDAGLEPISYSENTESFVQSEDPPGDEEASEVKNAQEKKETIPFEELPYGEAVKYFKKEYLEKALRKFNGDLGAIAKHTGIKSQNIYSKLNRLGIDRSSFKRP